MKVVNLISKTFFTLTIYIIPSVEKITNLFLTQGFKKSKSIEGVKNLKVWRNLEIRNYTLDRKMRNHHKIKLTIFLKIFGFSPIFSNILLNVFFLNSKNMFAFVKRLITCSKKCLFDSVYHSKHNLLNINSKSPIFCPIFG